jgi:hypothetical protein
MKNFGRVKTFRLHVRQEKRGIYACSWTNRRNLFRLPGAKAGECWMHSKTRRPDVAEVYPDMDEKTRYPMTRFATGCNELQLWDKNRLQRLGSMVCNEIHVIDEIVFKLFIINLIDESKYPPKNTVFKTDLDTKFAIGKKWWRNHYLGKKY